MGAIAYLQSAPLWIVAAWVFGLYIVTLAFGGRLIEVVRKRLPAQHADAPADRPELDRAYELEAQEQWRAQDALDVYLNQMQQWLDDEDRPLPALPYKDQRRKMARTRTLTMLKRLDPDGKRDVLQFLHEHELIKGDDPVIRLDTADLSNANLARMTLVDANVSGANLRGADLSDAVCRGEWGSSFSAGKAIARDVPLWVFNKPFACANLSSANLSDAVLKRARLGGCNLLAANFSGADLEDADLRGTDLRMASNLGQGQIEKAYGTHRQDEFLPDTMLPDGVVPPAAWSKSAHEQKAERG